ncbi:MAG: group I intron-associated PD-(D/E)XK endonuclease, partial [Candidatus Sulfotelmatobacter sp.]
AHGPRLFFWRRARGSKMDEFKVFKNFKERGEWVELRFMAEALRHGFKVLKPWGDSSPFDVAIPFGNRIVRVQVKSTSCRTGTGYFCQFKPNYLSDPYTLDQLDLFAAYVIMQDTWYIIPARILLGGEAAKQGLMLYPMQPLKKNRYSYEHYREAWPLLRPRRK